MNLIILNIPTLLAFVGKNGF